MCSLNVKFFSNFIGLHHNCMSLTKDVAVIDVRREFFLDGLSLAPALV